MAFRKTAFLFFLLAALAPWRPVFAAPVDSLRRAPEISGPVWFNVEANSRISLKTLRGQVVLIFFWNTTDQRSLEVIPRINAWYERYKNRGLEVIGVCASEWGFDISEAAVLNKVREREIGFPVVMDTDGSIWVAYHLSAWPSLYLIDRKGYIRGEFRYDFSWKDADLMLQMLLDEGRSKLLDKM